MPDNIDSVRYRNDGDDFQALWIARRALRLLDPKSGLIAVAVEGISEREQTSGESGEAGLLVIDTAEYYGSEDLSQATKIIYNQLKHSTTTPDEPWTVSGMEKTLKGFAARFIALCEEIGSSAVSDKVRFQFTSNRPISKDVQDVLNAVVLGASVEKQSNRAPKVYGRLLEATGLTAAEFGKFAHQLDLRGNQKSLDAQSRLLNVETSRYTPSLDTDASLRMKALVDAKALSKSANDKTIRLDTVLQQCGLGSERQLFPAEPKFEPLIDPIPRTQETDIVCAVLNSPGPVIIQAPGGVGKSVLAQGLSTHLPAGSEAVVFDGFAGGDYRNPRLYRHRHNHGLVQIANELARRGLCDILIPQNRASEQEYLIAFRHRLERAVAEIRAGSPDATLLIVIDAADNLGMAAEQENDRCFAPDLLREKPPAGCCIVALARTHRVEKYLKPLNVVQRFDLEPFELSESMTHLRRKFPDATDNDAEAFHRFTDHNPRVQANALGSAEDLSSLIDSLGPSVETVEDMISGQLDKALDRVIEEQASSRNELEPLLTALTALPPPIPIRILAQAAEMPESAMRSFISDFGNGRYIVISDDTVQFHDEPVETWSHERFMGAPDRADRIADMLEPLATGDGYVAAALPRLLHRAGRYNALIRLALEGAELETGDPVEEREVLLQRVQYALRAALAQDRFADCAKLLLRTGEEIAADNRQSGFLMENADLVSSLAGPEVVNDFIFRRRAWAFSEKGYVYCAAMLAGDSNSRVEADRFLELAIGWLRDWFARQEAKSEEERRFDREDRIEGKDIAAYAEVIRTLRGADALVSFMTWWRDWAAFNAMRAVVVHLLDRGDRAVVEELLAAAGDRIALRLAITLEMNAIGMVPSLQETRLTLDLLLAGETAVDLDEYQQGYTESEAPLAIVAVAEAAARCGIPAEKIIALLDRYPMPNERVYEWHRRSSRSAVFRAVALHAALEGQKPTLDDVMPSSLRKARKEKGQSTEDREERQFSEVYGTLLPWYELRALAITGRVDNWEILVETARKECKVDKWSRRNNPELAVAGGEAGSVWLDAMGWADRANDASIGEIERWLEEKQISINRTALARRAAHVGKNCYDSALRFASRSWELTEGEHSGAKETADALVALARALLPLDRAEASGYFQRALEHLGRLGHDELQERHMSMLAIAGKAAESGPPDPREAYRVARMSELFHAYNDHKFPWDTVAEAVAKLCSASGFAVISRWHDRGQGWLSETLPSVVLILLEAEKISPMVAASLHAFGGYWNLRDGDGNLRDRKSLFFEKAPDRKTKQSILDMLVRDEEFDPDGHTRALDDFLKAAEKYGLERQHLQARVDFHASLPDRNGYHYATTRQDNRDTPPKTDWDGLLVGADIHTPEGVSEAVERWQAADLRSRDWAKKQLFSHMRRAIDPTRRREHISALVHSQELNSGQTLDALAACAKDWGHGIAIQQAITVAVQEMLQEYAPDMIGRGWSLNGAIRQCAEFSGLSPRDVAIRLMRGLADRIESVSAGALFKLAEALTVFSLDPEEARSVLGFGLDRLEPVLKDDDGDGPWREALSPPVELSRAIAHFLYALLASPEAKMRWRAVHAVRRLCRFGETEVISALIDLLPSEELPAFTDAELPFYAMHARLYALIALARAAHENPEALIPHVRVFVHYALEGEPHVLNRHFAAAAALALARFQPGLIEPDVMHRLETVNVSPFPAQLRDYGQSEKWSQQIDGKTDQFRFDYEFDRYWLGNLSSIFDIPHPLVAERTESWIVDRWRKSRSFRVWNQDPRARKNLYRGDFNATHASHGSYPSIDRYSFYLGYHAMFCTAGELLAEFPRAIEHGEDRWQYWLSTHLLTRSDSKWLADRRDPEPLEARRWQMEKTDWERRDEWPYSVSTDDLDQALGIGGETKQLAVWGWWSTKGGIGKESVHISSALAMPDKSLVLLRALQTTDNPHDYKIPMERDELEINQPGFQLCGWIATPHESATLDQFDPLGGKIPFPGPQPGRRIKRLLKLVGNDGGRDWQWDGVPAMELRVWGDWRDEDRHGSTGNHGERLVADLDFLLGMLNRVDRDLIIEVAIERESDDQKNKLDFAYRGYTRLYLLRKDGCLHTLYGCRRLRPQAGS
uniref:NACHT domain-containing protein n=1 Tax=Candidatus Kentrum sp. DK TaxID=2126562 RepID=A0A450RTL0_9GAMM|nr:MAG: hypothetical protein BECKDK2373B_GA0170837_100167 [Candidatus Kentron sp. DK]VFJ48098.1 MAG: hypothetical protein BECKDK2373C_GA0170839_10207 [Candidatus Kentron sp. DK]